ncbi:hypothetical protein CDL15_Pgr016698 [Punica granatum]|uniref:PRONE domain-containing protein n=1 Tax=Punica granatum TaxID=22663 RepID=A0A218XSG6_PUNGR|nr:hypothetical protein CDL15_Pgr016698 [Punica granatum]
MSKCNHRRSDDDRGSVSSNNDDCDRCGRYSLSAKVSESESSSTSFCHLPFNFDGATSISIASFPRRPPLPAAWSFNFRAPIMAPWIGGRDIVFCDNHKEKKKDVELSEVEMMKERFAKLLLGEDMSGSGKGVCIRC